VTNNTALYLSLRLRRLNCLPFIRAKSPLTTDIAAHGETWEKQFGFVDQAPSPGMRFENILNDLKCILFEKYGFLFQKSPIHVYQYEMYPVEVQSYP
jgi:hypothetical protein